MKSNTINMKPDCFKCKYRCYVPGDAHICCNHPSVRKMKEDPANEVIGLLLTTKRIRQSGIPPNSLNIRASEYGIKKGWFNWPWNFDPVWLENCDGFEPKEE